MSAVLKRRCKIVCFLLCGLLAFLTSCTRAKPTIAFTLPPSLSSLPAITTYVERKHAEQMKSYSGLRQRNDSLIMVYYYDQMVAIVELGPAKLLLGCEIIEIYNEHEGEILLNKLSAINKPYEITFKDSLKLMDQCELVDKQRYSQVQRDGDNDTPDSAVTGVNNGFLSQNPFSLFSGIIPGTKWCGTGDIATTFSDLGTEKTMDRCCRSHDLCPVKIRAYQKRYNLTNNSLYTKSHCICDDMLYSCLKKTNTSAAQVMGSIYFNLVQVPCLQENTMKGLTFRKAREGF